MRAAAHSLDLLSKELGDRIVPQRKLWDAPARPDGLSHSFNSLAKGTFGLVWHCGQSLEIRSR